MSSLRAVLEREKKQRLYMLTGLLQFSCNLYIMVLLTIGADAEVKIFRGFLEGIFKTQIDLWLYWTLCSIFNWLVIINWKEVEKKIFLIREFIGVE